MFGIGGFELFIILIFAFLIFGPEKLPEIGRTVGRAIAKFREAQQDMNETLGSDKIFDPNNPDEPFKDPIEALDKLAKHQEEKKAAKESQKSSASAADDAAKPSQTVVTFLPLSTLYMPKPSLRSPPFELMCTVMFASSGSFLISSARLYDEVSESTHFQGVMSPNMRMSTLLSVFFMVK